MLSAVLWYLCIVISSVTNNLLFFQRKNNCSDMVHNYLYDIRTFNRNVHTTPTHTMPKSCTNKWQRWTPVYNPGLRHYVWSHTKVYTC